MIQHAYSLQFVASEAEKHNVTPVITFDQPLYWKALSIIRSQSNQHLLKNIILRSGGFHTEMCFLGSIGHLMAGSGLQEVLEKVYISNTGSHMLSVRLYVVICWMMQHITLILLLMCTMSLCQIKESEEDTPEVECMTDDNLLLIKTSKVRT